MTGLAALQAAVQRHLLAGGDAPPALAALVRPSATDRWRLYSEAYRIRLVEALAKGYPAIARRLDAATFGALMLDFVAAVPSTHRSIRDYGGELAAWLRAEAADADGPELAMLADLAAFEWALAGTFDAADAAPLDMDSLAALPPESWGDLRLRPAPSVRIVETATNAMTVWRALQGRADEASPPIGPPAQRLATAAWLLWRDGLEPRFRELDASEAQALAHCVRGGSFGALCQALEVEHGDAAPLQAVTWLKGWLAEGLFAAFDVTPRD